MKKKLTKAISAKKSEVSVKTKHVIVAVLGIVAVIILSSAVTVYYYGDKLAIYDVFSRADKSLLGPPKSGNTLESLAEMGVEGCNDAICKSSVGVAIAHYGTGVEECKGDLYCINSFYSEKAVSERDASYCTKITSENLRDHCYYNVALLTNDDSLCSKITSNLLKNSCANAL